MPAELGDGTPDWLSAGRGHVWRPYTQMKTAAPPFPVVKTRGVRLYLQDGTELIDGTSSWWTACHGYNHPAIAKAVEHQLREMPHVMLGGLAHEPAYRLASRLAHMLPGDLNHVFFSESGSVSVEIAMKMAIQYWRIRGEARSRFLSFLGGYHGDTIGAMSICDPEEGMHQLFQGALPRQDVMPLPVDEQTKGIFASFVEENHGNIAAVVLEPLVQAAGGMRFHHPKVVSEIRSFCDQHGLLLILDEIATGFGRTGSMFAFEQAGVTPDVICLSKALTGGTLPLAATVARTSLFEAFLTDRRDDAFMHGPTFMGNPLACAAANASLDLFESEDRLANVSLIEKRLREDLEVCRSFPGVSDVRVRGAIAVVELSEPPSFEALTRRFVADGAWIRPIDKVIYLMPPLVIGFEDLSVLTRSVVSAVRSLSEIQ